MAKSAEISWPELAGFGMAGLRDTAAAHYQSKRCYMVAMGENGALTLTMLFDKSQAC